MAACAPAPALVLINRSGVDIAFLPGVIVPSCDRLSLSREELTAAQGELERWFWSGAEADAWVPADAVQFTRGLSGAPSGAPDPMAVVISSQDPQMVHGYVPAELPPCGGDPVGIE